MGISDLFRLFKRRKDEQKIKNYIFQGGGTKGVAYIGALQELEKNGIKLENIKRIGGTSVGAITAALLSVGYDLEKLNEELKDMDFENFIDIENENVEQKIYKYYNPEFISEFMTKTTEYVKDRLSGIEDFYIFRKIKRLKDISSYFNNDESRDLMEILKYAYDHKGLAKGKKIREWIEQKISENSKIKHLTFGELNELHKTKPHKYKQLYLIGTNVSKKRSEVFSHENTPNVIISDAVRISMSLPLIFQPHQCYEKRYGKRQISQSKRDLYIDGGVMDNYPIWLFDGECSMNDKKFNNCINSETLGFRLQPLKKIIYQEFANSPMFKVYLDEKEEANQLMSNFGYLNSLVASFYDKQDSDFDMQSEKQLSRTILINDNNKSTFRFGLNNDEKKFLIGLGHKAAKEYLLIQNDPNKSFNKRNANFETYGSLCGAGIVGAFIGAIAVKCFYMN